MLSDRASHNENFAKKKCNIECLLTRLTKNFGRYILYVNDKKGQTESFSFRIFRQFFRGIYTLDIEYIYIHLFLIRASFMIYVLYMYVYRNNLYIT